MPSKPPVLDERTSEIIVNDLNQFSEDLFKPDLPWEKDISKNSGALLHLIYSRLMSIAIDRLNQVPEKNYLQFLDTFGVQPLTANPARTPLTFKLKNNMPPTLVPEGTKASSMGVNGKEICIFETVENITVLPMSIVGLCTIDNIWGHTTYADSLAQRKDSLFQPFVGEKRIPYLISFSGLRLNKGFSNTLCYLVQSDDQKDVLSIVIGFDWKMVPGKNALKAKFADDYLFIFDEQKSNCDIDTITAEMNEKFGRETVGMIDVSKIKAQIRSKDSVQFDHIFYNRLSIDHQGKTFLPFGSLPKVNDCLYLSCSEALYKATADGSLLFDVSVDCERKGMFATMSYGLSSIEETVYKVIPLNKISIQPYPSHVNRDNCIDLCGLERISVDLDNITLANSMMMPQVYSLKFNFLDTDMFIPIKLINITAYLPDLTGKPKEIQKIKITQDDINNKSFVINIQKTDDLSSKGSVVLEFSIEYCVDVVWEYYSNGQWSQFSPVLKSTKLHHSTVPAVMDMTHGFLTPANIAFKICSKELSPYTHNGMADYWIRARINEGGYGESTMVLKKYSDDIKGYSPVFTVDAPRINSLYIIQYTAEINPQIKVESGFDRYTSGVYAGNEDTSCFYMAFDKTFPEQPVSLYIIAESKTYNESALGTSIKNESDHTVRWEYFNGYNWVKLPVVDKTSGLTETGSLKFLTPKNMAPLTIMEKGGYYWIRAVREITNPLSEIPLSAVLINTVDSVQIESYKEEVLGSGNRKAGQTFYFANTPVLSGENVYVMEPEIPPENELGMLGFSNDDKPVIIRNNQITGKQEIWVRWREIPNFIPSTANSRHYVLDRETGKISFGNGQSGMLLPDIQNNIRVSYAATRGENGNGQAGSVNKLVSQIPAIEKVSNYVRAEGGSSPEHISELSARAPQHLRNQRRALSYEDYELLALEASNGQIARAKCLSNINNIFSFERGWVTIIIVPKGSEQILTPNNMLIQKILETMKPLVFCGLSEDGVTKLNISGPGYIQVDINLTFIPTDIDYAQEIKEKVIDALRRFLHPVTGGPNGSGWEFGRNVYSSEICQVVEKIPGVDHLDYSSMSIIPNGYQIRLDLISINEAYYDENYIIKRGSLIKSEYQDKSAIVAEDTIINALNKSIKIRGFKEGDSVTFTQKIYCRTVKSESGRINVVMVDGRMPLAFPKGSVLSSADLNLELKLGCDLPEGYITEKQIAGFEGSCDERDYVEFTVYFPYPMTVTNITRTNDNTVFLKIKPYLIEFTVQRGCSVSSLDGRIRLPYKDILIEDGTVTGLLLEDFTNETEGTGAVILKPSNTDFKALYFGIYNMESIEDMAYVSENYLVYTSNINVDVSSQDDARENKRNGGDCS